MIELNHITAGRAEYTFKCGWIDWSHAGGNPNFGERDRRDDVRLLWMQLSGAPLKLGGGFVVSYEPTVDSYTAEYCNPRGSRPTPEGYATVGPARRYFVRHSTERERYKRIAFQIYQAGCVHAENLQQDCVLDWWSGSAFSFEDFVSNLIGFYRQVEGWNKARILELCGALRDDRHRIEFSARVLTAMENADVDQGTISPTARNRWWQAYLLNDLAVPELQGSPFHGGPYQRRRLWEALPPEMRRLQPPPRDEHWYWRHPNADLERLYLRRSP